MRRHYKHDDVDITVIDQDDSHVYQPGLLFVPFGLSQPEDIVRSRKRQMHKGIVTVRGEIDRVDIDQQMVVLTDGCEFPTTSWSSPRAARSRSTRPRA